MIIHTINPTTELLLNKYRTFNKRRITHLIEAGHHCFGVWKKTSFQQRKQVLLRLSDVLRQKKDEFALLMASEMGKPIRAGRDEIEKCAWICEHYAEHAQSYLQPRLIKTEGRKNSVCYLPLGVIFGIMPWNYPFWQVFRFAIPTLMAGNAVIIKHASLVTGAGNAIEQLFLEAGFPKYLFQNFILTDRQAVMVIKHEKIAAVSLTGSIRAGASVASHAASHIKKAVLELGGNDPYLVLKDANLDLAANCIVTSRLNNCGQVCIAAKRIIAVKEIYDPLISKIKTQMAQFVMGNPLEEATRLGPMAREDLRQKLHQQVLESIQSGAKLLMGGTIPNQKGFYYPPTLLVGVIPGMPAFNDELFGPVVALIKADDEVQAIQLANQSSFGLGAAIFTQDIEHGEQLAINELEVGVCFVNERVVSDPRIPFGGIKQSGFGRELSREGILEFVNIKTVAVNVNTSSC